MSRRPSGPALTLEQVADLCDGFGLGSSVHGLLDTLRPAYRAEPDAAGARR